jgi:hypothetical protein
MTETVKIVRADEGRIVEDEVAAKGTKAERCAKGLVCLIGRTDEL